MLPPLDSSPKCHLVPLGSSNAQRLEHREQSPHPAGESCRAWEWLLGSGVSGAMRRISWAISSKMVRFSALPWPYLCKHFLSAHLFRNAVLALSCVASHPDLVINHNTSQTESQVNHLSAQLTDPAFGFPIHSQFPSENGRSSTLPNVPNILIQPYHSNVPPPDSSSGG